MGGPGYSTYQSLFRKHQRQKTLPGKSSKRKNAKVKSNKRRPDPPPLYKSLSRRKTNFRPKSLVAGGQGMSNSYVTKRYRPMKGLKTVEWVSPLDIYKVVNYGNIISDYGKQQWEDVYNSLNNTDIRAMFTQSRQTNTNTNNSGQSVTDVSHKLYLDSMTIDTIFTNASAGTNIIHIYDLVARVDFEQSTFNNPYGAFGNHLVDEAGLNTFEERAFYWGAEPTESARFRRLYKVLRKTKVELHTGRSHCHTKHVSYKGLLPLAKAYEKELAFQTWAFGGITQFTMVIAHGLPCDNGSAPTPGSIELVTLDKAKVIWATKVKYSTRLGTLKGKHLSYNGTFPVVVQEPGAGQMGAAYSQNPDGQGVYNSFANSSNVTTAFS